MNKRICSVILMMITFIIGVFIVTTNIYADKTKIGDFYIVTLKGKYYSYSSDLCSICQKDKTYITYDVYLCPGEVYNVHGILKCKNEQDGCLCTNKGDNILYKNGALYVSNKCKDEIWAVSGDHSEWLSEPATWKYKVRSWSGTSKKDNKCKKRSIFDRCNQNDWKTSKIITVHYYECCDKDDCPPCHECKNNKCIPMPDLIVESINFKTVNINQTSIDAVIENQGPGKASNFRVNFKGRQKITGAWENFGDVYVSSLSAHSTKTVPKKVKKSEILLYRDIKVKADSGSSVNECDESNNEKTESKSIPSQTELIQVFYDNCKSKATSPHMIRGSIYRGWQCFSTTCLKFRYTGLNPNKQYSIKVHLNNSGKRIHKVTTDDGHAIHSNTTKALVGPLKIPRASYADGNVTIQIERASGSRDNAAIRGIWLYVEK